MAVVKALDLYFISNKSEDSSKVNFNIVDPKIFTREDWHKDYWELDILNGDSQVEKELLKNYFFIEPYIDLSKISFEKLTRKLEEKYHQDFGESLYTSTFQYKPTENTFTFFVDKSGKSSNQLCVQETYKLLMEDFLNDSELISSDKKIVLGKGVSTKRLYYYVSESLLCKNHLIREGFYILNEQTLPRIFAALIGGLSFYQYCEEDSYYNDAIYKELYNTFTLDYQARTKHLYDKELALLAHMQFALKYAKMQEKPYLCLLKVKLN